MKKWHRISLTIISVLILLILLSLTTSNGRFFWQQAAILPIVKPFSEACGYGGTSGYRIDCGCEGIKIADIRLGSTNYYCTGSCNQCKCYTQDHSRYTETGKVEIKEADCATFSKFEWAFPYNKEK